MDIGIEQAFVFDDDGECLLSHDVKDYIVDEELIAAIEEADELQRELDGFEAELLAEDEEEVSLDDDEGIMDFD